MPLLISLENANLIERQRGNQHDTDVVIALTVLGNQIQYKTSQIQHEMGCETGLTELEHLELREKLNKMLDNFKTRTQRPDDWVKSLPADL